MRLQFFAANILGMVLYVGNPTNIIVAEANRLSFLGYSAWMALPGCAAGLCCFGLFFFFFFDFLLLRFYLPCGYSLCFFFFLILLTSQSILLYMKLISYL
jgi:hypothetical protein